MSCKRDLMLKSVAGIKCRSCRFIKCMLNYIRLKRLATDLKVQAYHNLSLHAFSIRNLNNFAKNFANYWCLKNNLNATQIVTFLPPL